jgi:hypothetical protein
MNYTGWTEGLEDAKKTMERADDAANTFARTLVGRLRKVSRSTLAQLKRELRDFNIQTKEWKS